MYDALSAQIAAFARLVESDAPRPADMRPMIRNLQQMFRKLKLTGRDFAQVPENQAILGLGVIYRVLGDLEEFTGQWRERFRPQPPQSRSIVTDLPDTRLEDCARSLVEAADAIGPAHQDLQAWIATVRDLHEHIEDPLVQLIAETAPDLEPKLLEMLGELLLPPANPHSAAVALRSADALDVEGGALGATDVDGCSETLDLVEPAGWTRSALGVGHVVTSSHELQAGDDASGGPRSAGVNISQRAFAPTFRPSNRADTSVWAPAMSRATTRVQLSMAAARSATEENRSVLGVPSGDRRAEVAP